MSVLYNKMSNTIVINSSNVINSDNNTFTYKLIGGNFKIPAGSRICISSVQIPYSIFNITERYGNNKFSFNWTVGAVTNTYVVTLPDGFYDVTTINQFLELFCINNGFYLVDGSGNNVYYLVLAYNVTYYSVQSLFFLVPTSLPAGFVQPANFAGYPTVSRTPGLIVVDNFSSIIGYSPGTYGNSLTNLSLNSNLTPIGSPVNSLILKCNLVDNSISAQSDILDSFTIGKAIFGSNIDYTPAFQKFVKIKAGTYSDLVFQFVDQNLNNVVFKDPNVLITILLDFQNVKT